MAQRRKAFQPTVRSTRNAFVRWMDPHRNWAIALGFKEAGDAVIAHAIAQPRHPDRFLFPAGFLYRHALEVQLKVLCEVGSKLFDEPTPSCIDTHHLLSLWKCVRKHIERAWPNGEVELIDAAEAVIREFDAIDPLAQSFRYMSDKKGHTQLEGLPESITLENLRDVMGEAFDFLDGCELGLTEELSAKREMLSEMRHLVPDEFGNGDGPYPCP